MVVQSLPLVQVGTPHAAVNLNPMSGLNVVTSHGSNVAVQGITPQGLVSLISLLQSLQQGKNIISVFKLHQKYWV